MYGEETNGSPFQELYPRALPVALLSAI